MGDGGERKGFNGGRYNTIEIGKFPIIKQPLGPGVHVSGEGCVYVYEYSIYEDAGKICVPVCMAVYTYVYMCGDGYVYVHVYM